MATPLCCGVSILTLYSQTKFPCPLSHTPLDTYKINFPFLLLFLIWDQVIFQSESTLFSHLMNMYYIWHCRKWDQIRRDYKQIGRRKNTYGCAKYSKFCWHEAKHTQWSQLWRIIMKLPCWDLEGSGRRGLSVRNDMCLSTGKVTHRKSWGNSKDSQVSWRSLMAIHSQGRQVTVFTALFWTPSYAFLQYYCSSMPGLPDSFHVAPGSRVLAIEGVLTTSHICWFHHSTSQQDQSSSFTLPLISMKYTVFSSCSLDSNCFTWYLLIKITFGEVVSCK